MSSIFKVLGLAFLSVYLLLNYYVGLRSLQAIRSFFPSLHSLIFWPIFLVIASAYLADRVFSLNISFLRILGSYWLAAFFYLLLFYLFIDILGLIFSASKTLPSWELYWQNKKVYALALAATTLILLIGSWAAYAPRIVKYDLQIAKKAEGLEHLKIVMVSDLHIEPLANTKYLENAARTVTSLHPDLILLAGDIVEGSLDPVTEDKLSRIIHRLEARYGIYAVLGNHESYGGQTDQITNFLKSNGLAVLRDEITTSAEGKIYIAGRNDYRSGHFDTGNRKKLEEILRGIDPAKPLILLDHQPQAVAEAKETGVDLMLSGHTHGGQLFPAQFVTKALFLIDRGLWQEQNFHLVVSTGLGFWGPPIRTSSRSEIVEINLTFAEGANP